jgi:hypothetical protein
MLHTLFLLLFLLLGSGLAAGRSTTTRRSRGGSTASRADVQ